MGGQDYIQKARILLADTNTLTRTIQTDPTNKHKAKLINILKKSETGMNDKNYRRMYSTGAHSPKFYGIPIIHKKDITLRPIVSSIGSVTYEVANDLVKISNPLLAKQSIMSKTQRNV